MTLFSRAFSGVPATFSSELAPQAAIAKIAELKRWAPGKPMIVGEISQDKVSLAIVPTAGLLVVRDSTRYEGTLVASSSGCVLQGRFVSMALTRAFSALFLCVICVMAVGGVGSVVGGQIDSTMPVGFQALFLVGWLSILALFGCGILWNATPTSSAMQAMTKQLQLALSSRDPGASG